MMTETKHGLGQQASGTCVASQLPQDRLVLHITKWLKLESNDISFSHLVICRTSLSGGS